MQKRNIIIVSLIVFVIFAVWLFVKYQEYQNYMLERRVAINKQIAESKDIQAKIEAENQISIVKLFDNTFERKGEDLYWKEGWAGQYLQNVLFRDNELRKKSVELTSQCPVNDKSCQTYFVYEWVVKNLKYVRDPRGRDDYIQNPHNTIEIGGGDCEDLTAVTMSMLENLGIRTYMILTEDHAYSLACEIDTEQLKKYISENSIQVVEIYNSEGLIKENYYKYVNLVRGRARTLAG